MTALAVALARSGGWPRMLLIAAATSVVSALMLSVLVLLRVPRQLDGRLYDLVQHADMRVGVSFAATLLTVPPLLLLYQAVRLGTVARDRRLAALRLVGATPGQVYALGAFEVGVPSWVGALGGVATERLVAGVWPRLLPPMAAPSWWQTLLVVAAVTATGVVVGWRGSHRVVTVPLHLTRRRAARAPRPWGALLLAGGAAAMLAQGWSDLLSWVEADLAQVWLLLTIGLVVFGIAALSSWVAHRVGKRVARRARSVALLLAARRLAIEPRPAGRAAAAVGGITLIAGGTGFLVGTIAATGGLGAFEVRAYSLVGAALIGALLLVTASLAVHSVETVLVERRTMAALVAAGTPVVELERSLRYETALVAMPIAVVGVLLGSSPVAMFARSAEADHAVLMTVVAATIAATLTMTWLATLLAARGLRPWVRRAVDLDRLQNE